MNKKSKQRLDAVEVFCRVRPLPDNSNESCLKILDESSLMLQIPECSASYRSGQIKQLVYSFTQIFDESTNQKAIFEQVGLPLVQDLLAGKNGLLFTYGVTGSGKTYTMIGNPPQDVGLLQRCLDTIFNSISFQQCKKYIFKPDKMNSFLIQTEAEAMLERQKREIMPQLVNGTPGGGGGIYATSNVQAQIQRLRANGVNATPNARARAAAATIMSEPNGKLVNVNEDHIYAVFVSSIEIYNNYIYDLLDEFNGDTIKRIDATIKDTKMLREDAKGAMYVREVTEIEVKSTEEALELMHRSQRRRVVACTDLNAESSRSHSVFTIRIVQSDPSSSSSSDDLKSSSSRNVHVSQLSLVDLAGSERTKRTKNTGTRLKEAGNINNSLMALRNCIEVLRENTLISGNGQRSLVPYRGSNLTLLFKSYFEGIGKIKMILCINPSSVEFDETINVLKFSDSVRDILVPVAANTNIINNQYKQQQQQHQSWDTLEQANMLLLQSLAQNNFSLMQENFPPLDVFSPDDDVTIRRLVDYLEEYQRKREATVHESDLLKQQFYLRIRELQDELDKVREERNDLRARLDTKERDQTRSDSKIKALEKVINSNNYVLRGGGGGGMTPVHRGALLSSSAEKAPQHQQQPETPITSTYRSSRITTTTHSVGRTVGISSGTTTTAHFNSGSKSNGLPPQTPSSSNSNRFNSATNTNSINRYQSPALMPTPFKDGVPVANRRAQSRRSRSADMWLDHKPLSVTKTDTVMQPKMPRKKSVSKIELCDTKKSSKYLLTHQQHDEDGELVTNLIKGDIMQSPSGGANVVFTDIETLRVKQQDVPKSHRKRPSEEFILEDRNEIQDRCSTAIEGHGIIKPSSSSSTKKAKV